MIVVILLTPLATAGEMLVNLGPEATRTEVEGYAAGIAADTQATRLGINSAGTTGQTNFDDQQVTITFTPGWAGIKLAAFSDDGVTVTGQESQTISLEGKSDAEILAIIQQHFVPSKQNVIYETKRPANEFPDNPNEPEEVAWREYQKTLVDSGEPAVVAGHAYYIQEITSAAVQLDNPWGEDSTLGSAERDLNLPVTLLSETGKSLTILAPFCN